MIIGVFKQNFRRFSSVQPFFQMFKHERHLAGMAFDHTDFLSSLCGRADDRFDPQQAPEKSTGFGYSAASGQVFELVQKYHFIAFPGN